MRFAVESRWLVFDEVLTDSDLVRVKAEVRVQPYLGSDELMFCGDERIARHCEEPVRLRTMAYLAELMRGQSKTVEESLEWREKQREKMLEYHGRDENGGALAQARADVSKAQDGTQARMRRTWP